MSTLADRLRGIVAAVPAARVVPHLAGTCDAAARHDDATADVLGGEWRESAGHRFLVVNRTYRPGHRHGRLTLMDHVLPDPALWQDVLTPGAGPGERSQRALFIDLETTGLAGGAGTYAFLVGCAWFEGCTFRVQQFFLSSYAAERVVLQALAELAGSTRLVVSYNGKSFDLPLIETRFLFNRMETPFAGVPHLDMLHPARRLWRAEEEPSVASTAAGCRLTSLEQTVCGHVREGDVPGFEVPARYFHYVRTGDPRPLEGVLEHNRLDLLSLAFLTSRAAQLVEEGPVAVRTAREALGLGRLYERAGIHGKARACFARGVGLDGGCALPGDDATMADLLRAYALVCRRERHYADAAVAWGRLISLPGCPPHLVREGTEALAIHHEHRLRDPRAAHAFARRSLPLQSSSTRKQALQHRLARLDRKLEAATQRPAQLF